MGYTILPHMMPVDAKPQLHPFFAPAGSKDFHQQPETTDALRIDPTPKNHGTITSQTHGTTASSEAPSDAGTSRTKPRQVLLSEFIKNSNRKDEQSEIAQAATKSPEAHTDISQPRKRRKLSNETNEILVASDPSKVEDNGSLPDDPTSWREQLLDEAKPDSAEPAAKTVKNGGSLRELRPRNPGDGVVIEEQTNGRPKRRKPPTRKSPTAKKARKQELGVIISYGKAAKSDTEELGARINAILSGDLVLSTGLKKASAPLANASVKGRPIHPYFKSRAAREQQVVADKGSTVIARVQQDGPARKMAFSSPGKLRAETSARKGQTSSREPEVIYQSFHLNKPKTIENTDAPWPRKYMAHVRGTLEKQYLDLSSPIGHGRKGSSREKRAVLGVGDSENIINQQCSLLMANNLLPHDKDGGRHPSIHLPQRVLTTGAGIRNELEQELSASTADTTRIHQTLSEAFANDRSHLTAFDTGGYERDLWTTKYSPSRSSEVLGNAKNVAILKDWLSCSALTGNEASTKSAGTPSKSFPKPRKQKKRKRQGDDLDNFIVSSDEGETKSFTEISDDESHLPSSSTTRSIKSLILEGGASRDKDESGRQLHNCVLISGPRGSGKTAAVYAVARELGFEVFEINPGSRRSGRDVLDRVEYMTGNHLVHRSSNGPNGSSVTDEGKGTVNPTEEALAPRQGHMKSFFQPKIKVQPSKTASIPTSAVKSEPASGSFDKVELKTPRRQPKQSLILLEEADILYESDKQFWSTITTLASHSKRPIVLTCNDERSISTEALPFFAILRFEPPPVDPTVDYLLLTAAREGHILEREAVKELYEIRGHDLRAAMMDLNFWCQMAVGDRKGGLEWFLQRWPPGSDVDDQGQLLRVASRHTYTTGMGIVSRDLFQPNQCVTGNETELVVMEAWRSWGVDIDEISESISPCVVSAPRVSNGDGAPPSIHTLDADADLESIADLFRNWATPPPIKEPIDATLPNPPPGLKADSLDGRQILYADPQTRYVDTPAEIATYISLKSCQSHRQIYDAYSMPGKDATSAPDSLEQPTIEAIKAYSARSMSYDRHTIRAKDLDERMIEALSEATLSGTEFPPAGPMVAATLAHRGISISTTDIAPYVRSIARFDQALEGQRLRLSNLLSGGGQRPPRLRMTRASRSALEGGRRETTRRERWFASDVNLELAMDSAGSDWAGLGGKVPEVPVDASTSSRDDDGSNESPQVAQSQE